MAQFKEITDIKANPDNPRIIYDKKFQALVKSIKEFPEMLEKRPLVCVTDPKDNKIFPLGGNQRFKAAKVAGLKKVPVEMADEWTPDQRRQFVIKDNVSSGEWNWEELKQDWNFKELENWGLTMPNKLEKKLPIIDTSIKTGVRVDCANAAEARKFIRKLKAEGIVGEIIK